MNAHTLRTRGRLFALVLACMLAITASGAFADGTENIVFADPVVEARIRLLLGKPEGPVTAEDMLTIEEFSYDPSNEYFMANADNPDFVYDPTEITYDEIRRIDDLAYCKNLRVITVRDQPIPDIEALRGLDKLESVDLFGCDRLQNLDPLADKASLRSVWINNTKVTDASAVLALPSLEEFNAYWGTEITDLTPLLETENLIFFALTNYNERIDYTPLLNHPKLESVTMRGVSREDFAQLIAAWPKLTSLEISDSNITSEDLQLLSGHALERLIIEECPGVEDLSALSEQTALEDLRVFRCNVKDVSPLAALTNLTFALDLRDNPIEDITPLAALTNLEQWAISANEEFYTREDVLRLLPYARVIYGNVDTYEPLLERDEPLEKLSEVPMPSPPPQTERTYGARVNDGDLLESLPNVTDPEILAQREEVVHFADPLLEGRIREILSIPEGDITGADMQRIQFFAWDPINEDWKPQEHLDIRNPESYPFESLKDIGPLAYCTNLREVTITYQGIDSIEALRDLEKLQQVVLHGCYNITDLSPLADKPALGSVTITGVPAQDVSPILSLPKLSTLYAAWDMEGEPWDLSPLAETNGLHTFHVNAQVEDYTPLMGHKKLASVLVCDVSPELLAEMMDAWPELRMLRIDRSEITGDDLAKLPLQQLQLLDVNACPLGDVSALAGIQMMEVLQLRDCGITDIAPLVNIRISYMLDLQGNDIEDISPLGEMHPPEVLAISESERYTLEDVQALLPGTEILYTAE